MRFIKQLIYLVIFIVIMGIATFGFYSYFFTPAPPTPTPYVFKPIEIKFTKSINVKDFDYDLIAKIRNPNTEHGSSNLVYKFNLYGSDNNLIASLDEGTYILPGQTKYIVHTAAVLSEILERVEVIIESVEWERLSDLVPEETSLVINQKELKNNPAPGISIGLNGILLNNSGFDFSEVNIVGVLFDGEDNIIGVGESVVYTVEAQKDRSFSVVWSEEIIGSVVKTDIGAYTDVFNNSNFIQKHGTGEKLQRYY